MGALSYIPRSRPQGEGLGDWTLPCQFKEMWDSQGPSLVLSWVSVFSGRVSLATVKGLATLPASLGWTALSALTMCGTQNKLLN